VLISIDCGIAGLAEEIMTATKNVLDGVAAVAPDQASWCNVMQALADDESISALLGSLCDFPHHVSASKELRDASSAADTKLSAFQVTIHCNSVLYTPTCIHQ
jgi:Zn-dependent oligopeptidase